MIIALGSKNPVKIQALEKVIQAYPLLHSTQLITLSVPSDVADQPLSLNETISGARNRARRAFEECDQCTYGFGIESGLMEVQHSKTGFMEFCACSIYDGKEFHLGQSCAFELPHQVVDLMINHKLDMAQACFKVGFTTNPKLGATEGFIGLVTNGRINREEYTRQAIMTALIKIENAHFFAH